MRLKEILREKGVSAKELCHRLGYSETGLSLAIKKGSFSLPRLREIAAALGVNVSELFTDEDAPAAVEAPQPPAARKSSSVLRCPCCGAALDIEAKEAVN